MKTTLGLATNSTAMVRRLRCSTDRPHSPGMPTCRHSKTAMPGRHVDRRHSMLTVSLIVALSSHTSNCKKTSSQAQKAFHKLLRWHGAHGGSWHGAMARKTKDSRRSRTANFWG
jgi:hypothetical protein